MKKFVLLSAILLLGYSFAAESAITTNDKGIIFEPAKSEENLIDVSGVRKVNQDTEKEVLRKNEKIQLNQKQLLHQRALDYTTKGTNSLLPLF